LACKNVYQNVTIENVVILLKLAKRINSKGTSHYIVLPSSHFVSALAMQSLKFIRSHMAEVAMNKVAFEELQVAPKRMVAIVGRVWDPQVDISALVALYLLPGVE